MSPMRLLLEGPDLQSLLQEIRTKYGTAARIVHAERVRRGGVAGFFAQERFTIQVEVPDNLIGPDEPVEASEEVMRSVMDLVDRLNEEEEALHQPGLPKADPGSGAGSPDRAGIVSAAVPAEADLPAAVPSVTGAPSSTHSSAPSVVRPFAAQTSTDDDVFTALATSAPQLTLVDPPAPDHPAVSTEGASFADVLARLERSVNISEPVYAAAAEPPAPVGLVAVPSTGAERLRVAAAAPAPVAAPPSATAQPARTGAERPSTSAPGGAKAARRTAYPSSRPATQTRPTSRRRSAAPRRPLTGTELIAQASEMGVPVHVLAGADGPVDIYRRLLSWVQSRPQAPMIVPQAGQVIAVAGEAESALRVARQLAGELGVDPSQIHLAVSATARLDGRVDLLAASVPKARLLTDVAEVATRRPDWRNRPGATVVVVEAGMPPADPGWLGDIVAALAPTYTWAVAQASTKVHDVTTWAASIGRVDALALVNVDTTADPATALAGPLPIGMLDGRRASVARWMALLTLEGDRR